MAAKFLGVFSRSAAFARRSIISYTGKKPNEAPGFDSTGVLRSMKLPDLSKCTRKEIRAYFDNTWALTEVLFKSLRSEDAFYRPPNHNLRHPKIFYLCHPATVYVNKLRCAGLIKGHVNEYYERIFETGVDEMRWDDMSKNHMKWPTIEECIKYRETIYNLVVDVIENHPEFDTISNLEGSKFWALVLGFEHERIHLETSSVLIRELPVDLVKRPEFFPPYHATANSTIYSKHDPKQGTDYPANEFIDVSAGEVVLGKPRSWPTYGWDNEYGEKKVSVKAFSATKFKITNGEFWEFVKSQGYSQQKYWSEVGWAWRMYRNTKWPTFWVPVGPAGLHQYKLRCMFDVIDMPWDWPAVVNYHEAVAFAAWKSDKLGVSETPHALRVLTELEHHRIRDPSLLDVSLGTKREPVMQHAGGPEMLKLGYNLNMSYGSETPVDLLPPSASGFHDVMGNTWEWCEDHFSALPGFKVHPYYDDFSLPCFDALHNIIIGGSWMSTGDEASIFARFHFRPHFHQFSSFRLVRPNKENPILVTSCMDNQGPFVGSNPFRSCDVNRKKVVEEEHKRELNVALQHHFDSSFTPSFLQTTASYPARLAKLIVSMTKKHSVENGRALDVGCGVGGVTFELARSFKEVIGVDLNSAVVDAAKFLQKNGRMTFDSNIEGDMSEVREAVVASDIDRKRVEFKQSDAYCLPAEMTNYDVVVVSNLLDEIPLPNTALGRMTGPRALVRPGGLLVVASPYYWREHVTPRDLWLGGFYKDGKAVSSVDGLKLLFGDAFELVDEAELPLSVRHSSRKYDVLVPHVSVWRAKA